MTIEGRITEISRRSETGPARRALLAAALVLAAPWGQAAAQESGFVVRGVAAEATAETATAARERAIAGGLRSAWATLLAREAPADQARLGAISAQDLERLIESYEVENERVGSTRYAATLTVLFRPEPVRALLAARPSVGPAGRIEVTAPLSGVNDWVEIRRRLAGAPAVGEVEILSLSRREARLALTVSGGEQAAAAALAAAGLRLRDGPGGRTLDRSPGT
ncbi:MAG: hypothetical protein MUC89_15460 [Acetobacteraceae bacterium]|nr:hypothetical protein [Acetobacteraceae bacterium]